MGSSNLEVDISPETGLLFNITDERRDVIPQDDPDYFDLATATQWDADFLPGDRDHLLGLELGNYEPKNLFQANCLEPSTMGPTQVGVQVSSAARLVEQFAPALTVNAPTVDDQFVTNNRRRKRKPSTQSPLSVRRAKKAQSARACARCWVKKREVLVATQAIGLSKRVLTYRSVRRVTAVRIARIPGFLASFVSRSVSPMLRCSANVRIILVGCRIRTDISEGEDKVYHAQLAWQNLLWGSSSNTVELRHLENGPTLVVECQCFTPNKSDETNLFWKAKEGWRAIETTAFGLRDPVKTLDEYVSQCAMFYQNSLPEHLGYIGVILAAMKANPQVRAARLSPSRLIPLTRTG